MNVLFFVQPGTNSRCALLDLMRGFEQEGHRVIHWDLEPMWGALTRAGADQGLHSRLRSEFTAMVRSALVHNRIDLSVSMWANALLGLTAAAIPGPDGRTRVASIFDLIPQRHLCYWLDAPHWAHEGRMVGVLESAQGDLIRSPLVHHAINNSATAAEMADVFGMKNVVAQHYGINEDLFRARGGRKEFDIVFSIGPGDEPPTKLMLEQVESQSPDIHAIRHEAAERVWGPLLKMADHWPGGLAGSSAVVAMLSALLRSQVESRHTPMLERVRSLAEQDPGLGGAVDAMCRSMSLYVRVAAIVRSIEAWERAFTFTYLSRRFRCATFGASDDPLKAWGARATHLGQLSWDEQSAAYSRAWLGLNVMRWQDDAGLNMKPYEITASGAACLCARREGIEALFRVGDEIAVFEGAADARAQAEALLSDRPRLEAMAEAGRLRTTRDYTWSRVASSLVHAVEAAAPTGAEPVR